MEGRVQSEEPCYRSTVLIEPGETNRYSDPPVRSGQPVSLARELACALVTPIAE